MGPKDRISLGMVLPHRSPEPMGIQAVRAEQALSPAVAPSTIELQRRNASRASSFRP